MLALFVAQTPLTERDAALFFRAAAKVYAMSDWKRCLLSGVLASVVACGSDDTEVFNGNASADDDGGATTGTADAGLHGGASRDAGALTADASQRRVQGDGGSNTGTGGNNGGDDAGEDEQCSGLMAHIRDFSSLAAPNPRSHPDFEKYNGTGTTGLVESTLGADGKPVFKTTGNPVQITSAASFNQWYNDTPGVNIDIPYVMPLTEMPGQPGSYQFTSQAFFPIDNMGFAAPPTSEPMLLGDDKKLHNFSFTTEVNATFTYHGGEKFSFDGDDDLWIFVNGKLALDLGGLHPSLMGTIDFDAKATELGIVKGMSYRMDIFHAERHTTASHFTVRTTIDCFKPVIAI